MRAFSSGERGLLFIVVHGLLIAVASRCGAQALGMWASVVVAHGLSSCGSRALEHRLSNCGARAELPRSMWDLPGPGLEPMSPALAGGYFTTAPPGKSLLYCFDYYNFVIQFGKCSISSFGLKIALMTRGLLCFHTNFRIICSISMKNVIGIFTGTALNLWYGHFNNINSLNS